MDITDQIPNDQNRQTSDATADNSQDILNDGIFSTKVSEDMTLRNNLRRGLVEAQGKNLDRIPLFVSWPNWLEDGIVCLYAKDLHQILHDTVQRTALAFRNEFGIDSMDETPAPFIEAMSSGAPASPPMTEIPPIQQAASPQTVTEEPLPASAEEPYTAAPPPPASAKNTPKTDQDIADQLFAELKKNRRD